MAEAADILERVADLFDAGDVRVSCPFCHTADFDGPGLLSHMFRRCDGKSKRYPSDAEIVAELREAAQAFRAAQAA